MTTLEPAADSRDRRKITSRKVIDPDRGPATAGDSLTAWTQRYLDLAVRGVRSAEVTGKIARHLERFAAWLIAGLGHDRVSAVTPREVAATADMVREVDVRRSFVDPKVQQWDLALALLTGAAAGLMAYTGSGPGPFTSP